MLPALLWWFCHAGDFPPADTYLPHHQSHYYTPPPHLPTTPFLPWPVFHPITLRHSVILLWVSIAFLEQTFCMPFPAHPLHLLPTHQVCLLAAPACAHPPCPPPPLPASPTYKPRHHTAMHGWHAAPVPCLYRTPCTCARARLLPHASHTFLATPTPTLCHAPTPLFSPSPSSSSNMFCVDCCSCAMYPSPASETLLL